jgi:hypothetical protein
LDLCLANVDGLKMVPPDAIEVRGARIVHAGVADRLAGGRGRARKRLVA